MSKLADLSRETQKLFRMLSEDVGVGAADGTWIALDFYNQGIGFDAEYQLVDIGEEQAAAYAQAVEQIAHVDAETHWTVRGVRPVTLVQCARVAMLADEGETVRLGTYRDSHNVGWESLTKERAIALIQHYEEWIEYRGMLQGIIHSLYKESTPPYFILRDLASRELIRCVFKPEDYSEVYRNLERKNGVVLVSGWIQASRLDRRVAELRMERMQSTKPLDTEALKQFFGSAPGWTGDLTSDEFIDSVRNERDADE